MALVVIGLNHRTLPPALLQRTALDEHAAAACLDRVTKSDHVTEAVILSTCMRTEVYVDAVRFHGAVDDVRRALADVTGVPLDELADHLFDKHEAGAVRHLFRVTAGLESAVVGESEILGQVARAWDAARRHGSCRTVLSSLFRSAVAAGKRVRHETGVGQGTTSIAQAAVTMVNRHLGTLEGRSVLVVGAGDMGDGMATAINLTRHVGDVRIANRTEARATELAERVQATVVPFARLVDAVGESDVVLCSTGANEPVLNLADVERVMAARSDRPLVLVDMAVPHDVDPQAGDVDGVTVLDLTDLESFTATGRAQRLAHVDAVQAILDEEVTAYLADVSARVVDPLIVALRSRFEEVRRSETAKRPAAQTPGDVDAITRAVVNKMLHEPTIRLKRSAGTPEGERMAEALRYLFGL